MGCPVVSLFLAALSGESWRRPYEPLDDPGDGSAFQRWVVLGDVRGYLEIRRDGEGHTLFFRPEGGGDPEEIDAPANALAALFERASASESGPVKLFATVRHAHKHDAWTHINPMYAKTLRLAITSRMHFEPGDIAKIVHDYNGGYWLGESYEPWYALCIERGDKSAAIAAEQWLGRQPFMLDGVRVFVGRMISWQGDTYRVTSIEADFVRAKREESKYDPVTREWTPFPATLIQISREGFEEKIALARAAAKAEREAAREKDRADPVDLLTVAEHLDREVPMSKVRDHYGDAVRRDEAMIEWAGAYGTDYKRAWKEVDHWKRQRWARAIGAIAVHSDADAVKVSWPKVEQALFRFVRGIRGLPLRDK